MTITEMKRIYVYECHICRSRKHLKVKRKQNATGETVRDYMLICQQCIDGLNDDQNYLMKHEHWKQSPRIKAEYVPKKRPKNKPYVKGMRKHYVKKTC